MTIENHLILPEYCAILNYWVLTVRIANAVAPDDLDTYSIVETGIRPELAKLSLVREFFMLMYVNSKSPTEPESLFISLCAYARIAVFLTIEKVLNIYKRTKATAIPISIWVVYLPFCIIAIAFIFLNKLTNS